MLVFYRCVTNYHTLGGLKQHVFISSHLYGSEIHVVSTGFCAYKAEVTVLNEVCSSMEALEKNFVPRSLVLVESSSLHLQSEVPFFLLAASWGPTLCS